LKKKDYDPKTLKFDVLEGKEPTEIEKIKAAQTMSAVTKLALADQKIIAVHLTFDVKGQFEIFHFGAAPEISKRAFYLAERIAEEIPRFLAEYSMPQVDIQDEAAQG